MAASTLNPARTNPSDEPPAPQNRSTTVGLSIAMMRADSRSPEVPAEWPQLALAAQRFRRPADGAAVLDQVDVQRVPEWGRDQVGEHALELLVIEAPKVQAELAVRAEPGEHPTDMRVGGENVLAQTSTS